MIHDLFPSPIAQFDNVFTQEQQAKFKTVTDPLLTKNTAQGFLQTAGDLHTREEMADFVDIAQLRIGEFVREMGFSDCMNHIVQMWANQYNGEGIHNHMHQNSFVSGVYYFSTGDQPLEFSTPQHYATAMIQPDVIKYTPYTATSVNWPVQANSLYLFPSWLRHSSPPAQGRYSISFNSLPKQLGKQELLNSILL